MGWGVKLMLISLDRKGASGPVTRVALAMMRRGGDTGPDSTNKQKVVKEGTRPLLSGGKDRSSSAFIKRPHPTPTKSQICDYHSSEWGSQRAGVSKPSRPGHP